jgi:5-methylcytosine-specific restriction endonuclease McrA
VSYESRVLECSVLVLNSSYAVLRLVSARRAFVLLVRQAAEVITIDGGHYESFDFARWTDRSFVLAGADDDHLDWVHTATLTLAVPRIIRLTDYHGFPRQGVALTRRNVYARDGNVCQYCGKRLAARQLTIDHVIPRSRGGTESWSNLVTACMPCNTRKGGRSPRSAGMQLIRKPVEPRRNPLMLLRLQSPKYHSWRVFLNEPADRRAPQLAAVEA